MFQIFYYDEIDDKIILCSNKGMDDSYFFESKNFGDTFKAIKIKKNFEKFQSSINFEEE